MLVLSRKVGERLMIGTEITITFLEIKGDRARVGIDAPKSLAIHRDEVLKRIQEEAERKK